MRAGTAVGAVFVLLLVSVVGVFDVWVGNELVRGVVSHGFARVPGRMDALRVLESRGDEGSSSYTALASYVYSVGGREYTGTRVRYGAGIGGGHARAERYVNGLRGVGPVDVYYNASDPEESVLVPGADPVVALAAVFLVSFNAMVIGAVWAMVSWIRYVRERPRAGGVLVIEEAGVTRVRIAHAHPVAGGLSWAGLMGFLGSIGIGWATGMDPSMTTVVVMAAFTVVAGVAGVVTTLKWGERFEKFVTIGGRPAMVGLPRIRVPVRVSEECVPAASVEDVRSRQVGSGDSTERVVTFFVREGTKRREIDVGVALGEERRGALAEFLRERIRECGKR